MESFEAELKAFAGTGSLKEALTELDILSVDDELQCLRVDRDWRQGGAETYNLIFAVVTSKGSASYLAKACTPFSPAVPIDRVLGQWINRRTLLKEHGVMVPHMYGAGRGMIIEDLIPYELDQLEASQWNEKIKDQVLKFATVLSELRFYAISPFNDLMTDGTLVYQVDFGQDLGDPYVNGSIPDYVSLAGDWLTARSLNIGN